MTSNDFSLKINNEEIELSKNSYYNDLQLILYFGYKEDEINKIFERTDVQIEEFIDNGTEISSYIRDNHIKGWIGSIKKPKDLSRDGNGAFVIAYMNNKIADENIFKNKIDARIASQYIVGEIQADFLDTDNDPITSSRQGLDEANNNVKIFIDKMEKIRKKFISIWDNFRLKNAVNTLPNRIKNNESYKEWLSRLSEDEKIINNKLLNLLSVKLDNEDELNSLEINSMITSIAGVINNISINETKEKLDKDEMGSKEQLLSMLAILMKKIEKSEQLKMAEIINSRIYAIDELEKLMDDHNTKEKAFQEHLYKNPWLINPFWNYDNNDINFEREREKYFKTIDELGRNHRNFIDILIKVAEEKYPIIIELKKNDPTGYAKVEFSDIYNQIKRYRQALIKNLTGLNKEDIQPTDILAIFILSEDASDSSLNTITITNEEQSILKNQNIQLCTYAQLLKNTKNMYKDFINITKSKKIIPNLS